MPNDNIERAIARAVGGLEGQYTLKFSMKAMGPAA